MGEEYAAPRCAPMWRAVIASLVCPDATSCARCSCGRGSSCSRRDRRRGHGSRGGGLRAADGRRGLRPRRRERCRLWLLAFAPGRRPRGRDAVAARARAAACRRDGRRVPRTRSTTDAACACATSRTGSSPRSRRSAAGARWVSKARRSTSARRSARPLQRRFRRLLVGADPNLLLVAGAAAGIAAIFKAPATGAVFALEVPYQDDLARRMLLPALVAAATGYLAFVAINGTAPLFPVHGHAAVLVRRSRRRGRARPRRRSRRARSFAWMLRRAKRIADARPPGRARRRGRRRHRGALRDRARPHRRIARADARLRRRARGRSIRSAASRCSLAILVLRCLATGAAVAGGGVGGLFVPLVVAGALLGRVFGGGGRPRTTRCSSSSASPRSSAPATACRSPRSMFVAETTGRPGFVVPGLIAAVVAELVMGRVGHDASALAADCLPATPGP